VDIRVGGTPPVGSPAAKVAVPTGAVEGRVLGVRAPRRRGGDPPHSQPERRHGESSADPPGGRVLILLIPDGQQLPEGLESGAWRVFLRFARR
jgi:hypothetical protein